MTKEELLEHIRAHGWVLEDGWDDAGFMVQTGPRSWRFIDPKQYIQRSRKYGHAPAIQFEDRFPSGRFKYMTHGLDDTRDIPCIEDYASEKGAAEWKDYVQIKDRTGKVIREGPKPFRSAAERKSYERLTGLRQRDKGEPWKRK